LGKENKDKNMRVITGIAKGRKIETLEGLEVRPTSDKVKGALFSILFDKVQDADVLDLYAGSGALGIEAISRGAKQCIFVDRFKPAYDIIKKNLETVNFQGVSSILNLDVFSAVKQLSIQKKKFDIIFIDPPYKELDKSLINKILENDILQDKGVIVVEHDYKFKFENEFDSLAIIAQKNYGKTGLTLLMLNCEC